MSLSAHGRLLGPRIENTGIYEKLQYLVQIKFRLVFLGYLIADLIQTKLMICVLQKEITYVKAVPITILDEFAGGEFKVYFLTGLTLPLAQLFL